MLLYAATRTDYGGTINVLTGKADAREAAENAGI
jgi:hypothetical protein